MCRVEAGMRRVLALAVLVLPAVGAVAGCASLARHATVTGTLVRVGGPAPGSPVPLPGRIVAIRTDGSRYTAAAGSHGRYQLALPPGTYQLAGYSPLVHANSAEVRCAAEHAIHVSARASVVGIEVVCSIP